MMKQALIVDDLPDAAGMLCEVVMSAFQDIVCICASDVASACAQLKDVAPNLALVDLELPDGNGTQIIAELNRRHPRCVSVVASIFNDDLHLFPALAAGAQGYIMKDQPRDMLVRQLRGIVEGQPPLSPIIARRLLQHFRSESANSDLQQLTPREREILALLARAMRTAEVSERLGISSFTVSDHVKNIYRKLNISSRAEAALKAKNMGLI